MHLYLKCFVFFVFRPSSNKATLDTGDCRRLSKKPVLTSSQVIVHITISHVCLTCIINKNSNQCEMGDDAIQCCAKSLILEEKSVRFKTCIGPYFFSFNEKYR